MWAQRIAIQDGTSVARRLCSQPGFAWLDAHHEATGDGRYSFLACCPSKIVAARYGESAPLSLLEHLVADDRDAVVAGAPRAADVPAWIGYLAYDGAWCEPVRGRPRFDRSGDPVLWFGRYDSVIAIDHEEGSAWVVGEDEEACRRLLLLLEAAPAPLAKVALSEPEVDSAASHRRAIERALEHIAAGDIYQVNLARRWNARFQGPALGLWLAMREASHVPLGMFLQTDDHAVLACTMERFLRWDRGTRRLVTKPIKGTLQRSDAERTRAEQLRADPKEQAEHVMIVDLMRNDVGRVAQTGTVVVEEPLVVEPFTGLYHLVSTVTCTTQDGLGLRDILEATFPPGSVTGAPKIRAVEIIEELEKHPREIYCGAVGFIDRTGGCSLAVAIRTAVVRNAAVHYWAGGGLVAASDPDKEVAETELKARVFLDALAALG